MRTITANQQTPSSGPVCRRQRVTRIIERLVAASASVRAADAARHEQMDTVLDDCERALDNFCEHK